jgi:serralysin
VVSLWSLGESRLNEGFSIASALRCDKGLTKTGGIHMATFNGTNYSDILRVPTWAWNLDNNLYGNGGNDALLAGNGDDLLSGGSGNDTLNGGYGWNDLYGGTGYDTVDYSFFATSSGFGMYINLAGGYAYDRVTGGNYVDDYLNSIEGVVGSARADVIIGTSGANILEGNSGGDVINGGAGNDELYGNRGTDTLTGGSGYDYFNFEALSDSNSYYGRDTITDFQLDIDTIDLSLIDARSGWSGNNAFTWKGYDTTFDGAQGELHYFYSGGRTVVEGDVNGDRVADIQIYLSGYKALIASDFIL